MIEIINKRYRVINSIEQMADGDFSPEAAVLDDIQDALDETGGEPVSVRYAVQYRDLALDVYFDVEQDSARYYTTMDTGESVAKDDGLEGVVVYTVAAISGGLLAASGY